MGNRCSYSKEHFWIRDDCTNNLKRRTIMNIAKYLDKSSLLMKWVKETIKNEAKKTKREISRDLIKYISCNCDTQ